MGREQPAVTRKQTSALIWLCSLVYFVSYVGRINLADTLVEVTASGFAATHTAALALTLSSVTYGTGQVVSGWMGDRFKPQHLILGGFTLTGLVNLCVSLLPNGSLLPVLWAVNGFAQSLMWPPLVVIMSACLNEADYQKATVRVSWGSSFGTIAVYLLAPVLLPLAGLRSVFLLSALLALSMGLVWAMVFRRTYAVYVPAGQSAKRTVSGEARMDRTGLVLIAFILLAILLQGSLRDGVSNWMPTLMADTFRLSSSASILTGVILPLFSLISYQLTSYVHSRWLRSEMACAGVIFGVGALAALVLYATNAHSMLLSLLCLALLSASMHGVNLLLVCITPRQFARYGRTGLISGVLNSATYAGSALSGYGMALFSGTFGWHATIGLWMLIALLGVTVCLVLNRKWKAFRIET